MESTSQWSINVPLISIPLYYVLAIYPHGHSVLLGAKGDLKRHDNRNPRATTHIDSVKRRLTKAEYAAWERAESCHRNHLENMPLMVAAIFAGLFAEERVGKGQIGLNEFAVGWMIIRVLYTVAYLRTDTIRGSYIRSLLYFLGSFWAFYILGISALVVGK